MISISGKPPAARAALLFALALGALGAPASPAPLLVLACGASLAFIVLLLWDENDPPILFLPALFQWSQAAILPISTIWRQEHLNAVSLLGGNLEDSALYGLAGVSVLALGLRLGAGFSRRDSFAFGLKREAERLGFGEVAKFSFAWIGAGYAFAAVSAVAGPAREIFHQAANVKYIGLFALFYWCLLRNRQQHVLAAVMGFEVVFGMTGFFAEFKGPVLTLVVAALAARPRLRPLDMSIVGASAVLLITIASFWSAVKAEYRLFVNQGSGAQVVNVPLSERLGYLADSVAAIDDQRFAYGFNRLVARHGYVEFLGLAMAHVPAGMPHEDGALTLAVVQHIAMPRFLFPEKPALPSDTVIMAKYTGLQNLWTENTSISIGYLGELYIDFGYLGGLAAGCVIGFLGGSIYRILSAQTARSALVTAGICLMAALPLASFETAYVKLVGSFVMSAAIAFALQRAPMWRFMSPLPKASRAQGPGAP